MNDKSQYTALLPKQCEKNLNLASLQRSPYFANMEISTENSITKPLNPWFSIWIKPRETARQVQATYSPKKILWLTFWVYGLPFLLMNVLAVLFLANTNPGAVWALLLQQGMSLLVVLPIMVLVLKKTTSWLGSRTSWQNFAYLLWPSVAAFLIGLILGTVLCISLGAIAYISPENLQYFLFFGVFILAVVSLWVIIAKFTFWSEILRISAWRVFFSFFFCVLIIFSLAFVIGFFMTIFGFNILQ